MLSRNLLPVAMAAVIAAMLGCQPVSSENDMSYDSNGSDTSETTEPSGNGSSTDDGARIETHKPVINGSESDTSAGDKPAKADASPDKQTKEQYLAGLEEQIAQLDKRYDQLEKQTAELSDDAKAKFEERMNDLKQKRKQLGKLVGDIRESTGDAWKDLRDGVSNAWDELTNSTDETEAELNLSIGQDVKIDIGEEGVNIQLDNPPADESASSKESTQ